MMEIPMTMKLITAFVLAFLFATAFGKYYIPWLRKQKMGHQTKAEVQQHLSKSGTPGMGGVMFILAVTLVCLTVGFSGMLNGRFEHIFVLIFAWVFGIIGFLDDWEKLKKKQNTGLSAKQKFLLQLVAALLFILVRDVFRVENIPQRGLSYGRVVSLPATDLVDNEINIRE